MRTILASIFCSLFMAGSPGLFAQSGCGTPGNFVDAIAGMQFNANPGPYTVRVFAHFIRRSDGTGGITAAEFNTAMTVLSQDLQQHNICISLLGTDQILNNTYYNGNLFSNASAIAGINNRSNAIDLYFCPNTSPQPGGTALAIPSSNLVIGGTWSNGTIVNTSHILSHEFGHCMGLFHTHHGSNEGNCNECVTGTNCSTCGDFVCDTPADPGLGFNVNPTTCTWNGSGVDPCGSGQPYNPDELNIMSYTFPTCMSYYTAGQGQRMRDHLATQPVLQAAVVPNDVFVQNITFNTGQTLYAGPYSVTAGTAVTSGTQGPVLVNNTANVEFRAKDYIKLQPGFDAWPTSTGKFFTTIQPNMCSVFDKNNSSFGDHGADNRSEQAYRPLLQQSEWLATTQGFEGYINGYYNSVGDSSVNDQTWIRVKEHFVSLVGINNDPAQGGPGQVLLLRENLEEQRVYRLDPVLGEQLLYDFNLSLGASLPGDESLSLSAIDSILLPDGYHERFTFKSKKGVQVVWVEGVGNIAHPFQPKAAAGGIQTLLCSRQEDHVVYDQGDVLGIECRKITAYALNPTGSIAVSASLSPNPTSSDFVLEFEQPLEYDAEVLVLDMTGRRVLQTRMEAGNTSLDISISQCPSGIYMVRASNAGKMVWAGKIVKE